MKKFHLQHIFGFTHNLVLKLIKMNWLLINSGDLKEIITSDHPTILLENAASILDGKLLPKELITRLTGRVNFNIKQA